MVPSDMLIRCSKSPLNIYLIIPSPRSLDTSYGDASVVVGGGRQSHMMYLISYLKSSESVLASFTPVIITC